MLPLDHPDRIQITFDDHRLVANAGLILPTTLARHLGLPQLVQECLDLGNAPGRANTGDKIMTLVASALAGGDCIDDADVLRTGGTARQPTEPLRQLAPSRSASASRRVLARHLAHHSHCRPPSAPPKAPADRRQPPVYPNSSPDHRACNSLTLLPLSSRRPSVSIGGFGLSRHQSIYRVHTCWAERCGRKRPC